MSFIFGFLCAFISFVISLDARLEDVNPALCWTISGKSLIFSLILGIVSEINGYNNQMYIKSRVDYHVNLFISSLIGISLSGIVIYLISYSLVGRWVFIKSILFFNLFFYIYKCISVCNRFEAKIIIGISLDRFVDTATLIGETCVRKTYKMVECTGGWSEIINVVSKIQRRKVKGVHIVGCDQLVSSSTNFVEAVNKIFLNQLISINILIEEELGVVAVESVRGLKWWEVSTKLRFGSFVVIKRIFDLILSTIIFILSAPVVIFAVVAIRITDPGPVIYKQKRVGQYGREFWIYKLRTMYVNSEKNGAVWAQVVDPRVTPVGRFLRRTRIDELPQIWNVLKGEMSLIGPRPERPEFYSVICKVVKEFNLRLASKPGLSGWAQVNYPYGASLDDAKAKLMFDLYYIKHASFILDLRIAMRTVIAMVKGAR